jgi:hypothetical protein
LKSWLLIYFPRRNGSASFSIFSGGPWKWKFRRQRCSQPKADRARYLDLQPRLKADCDADREVGLQFPGLVSGASFPTRTEAFGCFHGCCRTGRYKLVQSNVDAGVVPILSSLCRRFKGTRKAAVQKDGHFRYKIFWRGRCACLVNSLCIV